MLSLSGFDCDGLSGRHLQYLTALHAQDGTTGLRNLCSMLQLSVAVVEWN